jgi:hypothetical protein
MRLIRISPCAAALAALALTAFDPAGVGAAPNAAEAPELTVFLSDPELGVVGAYRRGDEVVYFEAGRGLDEAVGAAQTLSVRLLDASGRTLAMGGRSQAAEWLGGEPPDPDLAARAVALLPELAARLVAEVAIPAAERQALARLAGATGGVSLTGPLLQELEPALALAPPQALRTGDGAEALELRRVEDGVLEASFHGRSMLAADVYLPLALDEVGSLGRTETYAALRDQAGQVVAAQLGGDEVPAGLAWSDGPVASTSARARVAAGLERGQLVAAAQAAAQLPATAGVASPMSDPQREAFVALGRELRATLLPQPMSAAGASVSAASGVFQTEIRVFHVPIYSGTGEHSASRVNTTTVIGGARYPYRTLSFCNHGRCYNGRGMTRQCTYASPLLAGPREPKVLVLPKGDEHAGTYHSCATKEHWSSYCSRAFFGCTHNCNDDTWTQVRYVRGLAADPKKYRCADGTFHAASPGCGGK